MTQEDSDIVPCPKCGNEFPMSKMHEHYQNCKGRSDTIITVTKHCNDCDEVLGICKKCFKMVKDCDCLSSQAPPSPVRSQIPVPPPIYVEPQRIIKEEKIKPSFCKKCGTQFIENDMFRVCPKDKTIKIKMKMWWWIIFRYGMLIAWVSYALGAFTVIGLYHR